jgi:hypothetical protein
MAHLEKFNYIPKEACLYFPKEKEIIEYNYKKPHKLQRKIFECVNYTPFEMENIKKLYDAVEKSKDKVIFLNHWKLSDTLRFLQSNRFKIDTTIQSIKKHMRWLKEHIPPKVQDNTFKILNCGFLYVHGRDSRYRPIVMVNTNAYLDNRHKYSYHEWENACIYLIEFIKDKLLLKGQIESWMIFCDLGRLSLLSAPNDLKELVLALQDNFPCRTSNIILYGVSGFISILWTLLKSILDKVVVKKMKLLSHKQKEELFQFVNKEQIEQRFGGFVRDKVGNFFPPHIVANTYLLPTECKEDILVSKTKYKEIMSNNLCFEANPRIIKHHHSPKHHNNQMRKDKPLMLEEDYKLDSIIEKTDNAENSNKLLSEETMNKIPRSNEHKQPEVAKIPVNSALSKFSPKASQIKIVPLAEIKEKDNDYATDENKNVCMHQEKISWPGHKQFIPISINNDKSALNNYSQKVIITLPKTNTNDKNNTPITTISTEHFEICKDNSNQEKERIAAVGRIGSRPRASKHRYYSTINLRKSIRQYHIKRKTSQQTFSASCFKINKKKDSIDTRDTKFEREDAAICCNINSFRCLLF